MWQFVVATLPAVHAAHVNFLNSRFTFSLLPQNAGIDVHFDCPADRWCGMIVSESIEPQVFELGDTYVLARHGICTETCCQGLRDNDYPDHSCPHPKCCTHENAPIGIRSYADVMGEGWSWAKDRGVGRRYGLRGDATYTPVNTSSPDFIHAAVIDGRNTANLSLPYNTERYGFWKLDASYRAVIFSQANIGALSFDNGKTSLDIGYHGPGAFTACLVNGTHLCGCKWEFDYRWSKAKCVPFELDVDPNTFVGQVSGQVTHEHKLEATQYKCTVCQHVYDPVKDGDGKALEDLPDTWKCPVCGKLKSAYKSITEASNTGANEASTTGKGSSEEGPTGANGASTTGKPSSKEGLGSQEFSQEGSHAPVLRCISLVIFTAAAQFFVL